MSPVPLSPGDVVLAAFPGAVETKFRPAVVLSSDRYQAARPDCIIGVGTTNLALATTEFDHVLLDWRAAGLDRPSAYRSYLATVWSHEAAVIGRLSERDWRAVCERSSRVFPYLARTP
jgi:hypothetical protein